jgi:hypothetical protein
MKNADIPPLVDLAFLIAPAFFGDIPRFPFAFPANTV